MNPSTPLLEILLENCEVAEEEYAKSIGSLPDLFDRIARIKGSITDIQWRIDIREAELVSKVIGTNEQARRAALLLACAEDEDYCTDRQSLAEQRVALARAEADLAATQECFRLRRATIGFITAVAGMSVDAI